MILKRFALLMALLVGLTTAQGINLKKLYDGIEDMRQEYADAHSGAEQPGLYDQDSFDLGRLFHSKNITIKKPCGNGVQVELDNISVVASNFGSYTKQNARQKMLIFGYCSFG